MRSLRPFHTLLLPALALLVLIVAGASGCSRPPPSGQILARVNGTDITRRDVLIELTASGAPADVNADSVTPALLDRLVSRQLLVDEATRLSIDRSPEFLGEMRRSRDILLTQLLGERLLENSTTEIDAESNLAVGARDPGRLVSGQHQIFKVDRIVLLAKVDSATLARLPSLDAAASWLARRCLAFRRGTVELDSLTLDPGQVVRLRRAGKQPVVGQEVGLGNENGTMDQVLSIRTQAVTAEEQETASNKFGSQEVISKQLDQLTNRLRKGAHIQYARGQAKSGTSYNPSCTSGNQGTPALR